ncbi:M-phase inducer phosphatase 1-B-like isoform X2 [Acanthaster planci]|uniref:M-phase inducer phosphatase n=1 Tax=Acanthaster planci TaxID=133434 RepID=A0A8B7Y3T8_ACAPL|nr:M-phase inducer phosphatase 1-B-like isoform X2 [Acanthaster planci]
MQWEFLMDMCLTTMCLRITLNQAKFYFEIYQRNLGPSAFRRVNSKPSCQAIPQPPVFSLSKELKNDEGGSGCLATEPEGAEGQRNRSKTIMWEACNDKENINIQNQIATYQSGRPRQISFIESGTSDASGKDRPISAPAALLDQSSRPQMTIINSPVKLQHCRLASSNDDDEEDGFTDIFAGDANQPPDSGISEGLSSLMNAPLLTTSPPTPTPTGTSLPLDQPQPHLDCNALADTPGPKCRRGIFKVPSQPVLRRGAYLKRPDRPRDTPSPVQSKRYRSCSIANTSDVGKETIQTNKSPRARPLSRSHSMDDSTEYQARIAMALMPNVDCTKLTGDLRKPYALPVCKGKHQDLQSITPETVCQVLRSEIAEVKEHYILDCRYPYEYNGGHIKGAKNLYTKELVSQFFLEQPLEPLDGRVIIFHCEFSSKRGPDLLRFLRNKDREANPYPELYYPELYILQGGYKAFYEHDKTMCEPQSYTPMDHEGYRKDCLHFKAKSKSWAGERSRLGHRKTSVS